MTRTVATFLCARCVAENRRKPGVLGRTVDAEGRGLIWYRNRGRQANGRRPGDLRVEIRAIGTGRQANNPIPVHCRYHGPGQVASAVALSGRGTVVVDQ